ncbi:MAG TPA: VOC family protein [Bryobacteraceae bacterium]|nr:VOC family protein [Bryobacteraceae bacterium]
MRTLILLTMLALASTLVCAQSLAAPGFHHLHLNSTNPEAAIAFYTKQFPSTERSTFAGQPALKTGRVYVLFNKVATAPPTPPNGPQTAIWHFGWHITDERANLARYQQAKDVQLLPLYTGEGDGYVLVSSDTWPGTGGSLGLTGSQIAEAKAKGVKPAGGAGFAYMQGPDNGLIEYQGNMPRERFNHVHMYQEQPLCAQAWYVAHLNAAPREGVPTPPESDCKAPAPTDVKNNVSWPALEKGGMLRSPTGGVLFDDVALNWYVNPSYAPGPYKPLAPTRGQLYDHFALSVADLDAWTAKLQKERVKFLGKPYKLGDSRAVMIEGPSREAIELVEVKK